MHEVQNRIYSELYDAIYESKLCTKMHQNMSVDFKLGYVDAKSDAIASCVKTYSPGLFINNRTNIICMKCKIGFTQNYTMQFTKVSYVRKCIKICA